jgi:hypothetical protein
LFQAIALATLQGRQTWPVGYEFSAVGSAPHREQRFTPQL